MPTDFDDEAATWDTPEKIERSREIAEAIASVVPLDPRWTVLDFGCGTGQLTWHLADRVGAVTLVDTSEGMLAAAREQAKRRDSDRYTVRNLDLTGESLDHPVDLIISAMTLHHVPDTRSLVEGMHRTLRPGGWVALADLDADPENHFHDDDFDGHRGIDRDELARLCKEVGFEQVSTTNATTAYRTKNGAERAFTVFLLTARRKI